MWLDTKNPFGSVSHQVLWSILRGYGFPAAEAEYLERLYSGNRFYISGSYGRTAGIHTYAGVGQGDITSPLLWNLVVNAMLQHINGAGVGYQHESGVSTSALAYIDDCCVLSESEKGLTEQVCRLNKFYDWAGLRINSAKCAILAHDFWSGKNFCTEHIRIHGESLPQYSKHRTHKYLGMEIAAGGSWTVEKARVRRALSDAITALRNSPYTPRQLDQVVRACLLPIFRYGAGLVDWMEVELDSITVMWATARRLAWKLAPCTPHCLHTLSKAQSGGQLPHARLLWAKEMMGLLTACRTHDDELRRLAEWEWSHSAAWVGCFTDTGAAAELTLQLHAVQVSDLSNRYRRICRQLETTVKWLHSPLQPKEQLSQLPPEPPVWTSAPSLYLKQMTLPLWHYDVNARCESW